MYIEIYIFIQTTTMNYQITLIKVAWNNFKRDKLTVKYKSFADSTGLIYAKML